MVAFFLCRDGGSVASLYPDLPNPVPFDACDLPERSCLLVEEKPRPFRSSDRAGMLEFFRKKAGVPYEEPSSLDAGKCVIPFGYVTGHNPHARVIGEREAHEERVRLMQLRRRREARAREPWADGEWAC